MSSQASSPASPASITEEISTRTMSDVVKDFNTEELIEYLGRKDLKLKESHFKILRKEEITGRSFLKLTEEKLERYGNERRASNKTCKLHRRSQPEATKLFLA